MELAALKRAIVRRKQNLKSEPFSRSYAEQEVRELTEAFKELCSDYSADESKQARQLINGFEDWAIEHAKTGQKV